MKIGMIGIIFFVLFCLTGCSLERDNLLDPKGNSEVRIPPTPDRPTSVSSGRNIIVQWARTEDAELVHHYNLYRGNNAHGPFHFIQNVPIAPDFNASMVTAVDETVVSGLTYFYRVSGVSPPVTGTNPPQGLEGRLSEHCGGVRAGGG